MRLALVAACVSVLAVPPAHALDDTARYELAIGAQGIAGRADGAGYGGYIFPATGLKLLSISLDDDNTELVPAWEVCQDTDADGFCGEAGEPDFVVTCANSSPITPPAFRPQFDANLDVVIFVYTVSRSGACRTAVATSGYITVTYEDPEE